MTTLPPLTRLAFLLVSSLPLAAQLDLPKGGATPTGGQSSGVELPTRRRGGSGAKRRGPLNIGGTAAPKAGAQPTATESEGDGGGYTADATGAARFVFDKLRRVQNPNASIAESAVDSLSVLGVEGLDAARRELSSKRAVELVVAARVLLRFGSPEDRQRVAQRLRASLPVRAAEPALEELLMQDPVLGSPRFLVELLDHPTGAMRAAAERALEERLEPRHVALLAVKLRSSRMDTRLRAAQLTARVGSAASMQLLLDRLGDSSSKVASFAAEQLSGFEDAAIEGELRTLVFPDSRIGPVSRQAAYGLLALLEREELLGKSFLDDSMIPTLLQWLRAPEELVSGIAAIALADLGFRSDESQNMDWLDRDVPHHLVRLVSGLIFHRDFSSLRGPAEQRLTLISGQAFGSDGPVWQSWWIEASTGFRARRAVMAVDASEVPALAVRYFHADSPGEEIVFLGPAATVSGDGIVLAPRVVYLDSNQCAGLVSLLRSEGVFSRIRLPSHVRFAELGMLLDVSFPTQGKRFELAKGEPGPWAERIAGALRSLAHQNRWQRHYDRTRWETRLEFWNEEVSFWEAGPAPAEGASRFARLLFDALLSLEVEERAEALDELADLEAERHVLGPEDFPKLVGLLQEELLHGPRGQLLVGLALTAASKTAPGNADLVAEPLAVVLVDVLATRFGKTAVDDIARTLAAAGDAGTRFALADDRGVVRRAGASLLVRDGSEAAMKSLLGLLDDPDPAVGEAAIRGLGDRRYAPARTEMHVRARLARGNMRQAALYAVGRLGGEHAREVLVLGLADSDPGIQHAAVEAMAELKDPHTLGILISIFARGNDSHLFGPARLGLVALGEEAWTEVVRLMVTAAPRTRRDAALFLAEQNLPEAASTLIAILTDNPEDARAASELAVLTGMDYRNMGDPAQAWWLWWDLAVHDDALAWLLGAAEAEGLRTPPAEALREGGGLAGARFLLELCEHPKLHLVERARRELERLLGHAVRTPPGHGAARRAWKAELSREIESNWQE